MAGGAATLLDFIAGIGVICLIVKRDVCLDAENALDPFCPPLASLKSPKQNKMLLISRLFWEPVDDCFSTCCLRKDGFSKLKWGMNEHLAAAAAAATCCHQNRKQLPKTRHGPCCQFLPLFRCPSTPHLQPTQCRLAPGLSCPPCARKLFTKGNSSDKGIKIVSNDGKHFAERSVDKRGNRAVKKIGGEGQRGEWADGDHPGAQK